MKTYQLSAEPRTALGKKATKALRQENLIPVVLSGGEIVDDPNKAKLKEGQKCVVIGNGKGLITTDLTVKAEDVRKLIYTPEIFVIELNIKGEVKMAVIKDIQFHPVTDNVLHIDLLEVNKSKPVVMEVPVQLEGHAEGVKAGGKLNLMMKKIKVKAIYDKIPERVVINVDNLALGKSLQIGELSFEGLELVNAKNAVVCSVQLTRAARGQQAAAETEEA
ncbi:MAG: 50S ribosomal protein L25 [Muribaculaceae bacterium]|nr:50S ribosomal protein L25 [Muribaculaceae bacterium]MBP5314487.1 50S ribosomal protein L25 [Muribaculaceae bacterium]MBR5744311.1 50S ribosomal protein L25 [Muribaculaceae bacterium]